MPELAELEPLVRGNVGLVFCKGDMGKILEIIETMTIPAEAKSGTIAPIDVTIPAGPTGMDPG